MGEGLLLLEAELGLLRRSLGARHGSIPLRIPLDPLAHWEAARAVHLRVRDRARVNEARRVVHAVLLGGLAEVHVARLR